MDRCVAKKQRIVGLVVATSTQSASEIERLRRQNRNLQRENEQLRGVTHVVRVIFTSLVNRSI